MLIAEKDSGEGDIAQCLFGLFEKYNFKFDFFYMNII